MTPQSVSESNSSPLSAHAENWHACAVHPWVLSKIEWGYRLQFVVKPPAFNSVLMLTAEGESVRILEEEITSQLSKSPIRVVVFIPGTLSFPKEASPSHPGFAEPQQTPQKSGHSLRILDCSVWFGIGPTNFYEMCRGSSNTAENSGSQSVSLFGRSPPLCSIMAAGWDRHKSACASYKRLRLQNILDEKLLSAQAGNNLLGSQAELYLHQVNSWLSLPFPVSPHSPIQTMLASSRPDGLGSVCHPVVTVANERVSVLGSGTALMSVVPSQPQSDCVITLLARSPLLERSRFSRIRDSDFSEKISNDGCVVHRLWCSVRGQNSEKEISHLATERT